MKIKKLFIKKCSKYKIDKNKRLLKAVRISNIFDEKEIIKDYAIIPPKLINKTLENFHISHDHKGYLYLAKDILSSGYYINDIYRICAHFIKKW